MTDTPQDSVKATYDTIAEHFAATREYAWPEVESFCASQQIQSPPDTESIGVDIGCGNGRHAETLFEQTSLDKIIGVDVSRELLHTAQTRATNRGFIDELRLFRLTLGHFRWNHRVFRLRSMSPHFIISDRDVAGSQVSQRLPGCLNPMGGH
jgi:Methyltransferase domain.